MICLLYIFSNFWLNEQGTARPGKLIIRAAREGQPIICLSALFAPFMARGPSSELELRRWPSYHLRFVSFAHLYGGRPKQSSLSLPFCAICPPLLRVACPRSERSVAGPVIFCLLFNLPTFVAHGSSGPAFHCLSAHFLPRYGARPERASLSFVFLLNLPPFWHMARAGQLINALLLFVERGPSGPVYHLRDPS